MIGAGLLIAGLFVVVASWVVFARHRDVVTYGTEVAAQVIDKTEAFDTDGATEFLVEYRWSTPAGAYHVGEWPIDREAWNDLTVGDPVAIRYLESDPKLSLPVGHGTSIGLAAFLTVVGLLLAAIGVAGLVMRRAPDSPAS